MRNYLNAEKSFQEIGEVAINAARLGGESIMRGINNPEITKRKGPFDVQVSADLNSEKVITGTIHTTYPAHQLITEENLPLSIKSNYKNLWIIDPLDGSNNYAIGIPYFGVAISYFQHGKIRLAVIYDPVLENLYYVETGQGAKLNGELISVSDNIDISVSSISLVINYSREARHSTFSMRNILERQYKRILQMWAPAMDLARLSAGKIDGMICIQGYFIDTCAGILMLQEAGGIVTALDGGPFNLEDYNPMSKISFLAASNATIHKELLYSLATIEDTFSS